MTVYDSSSVDENGNAIIEDDVVNHILYVDITKDNFGNPSFGVEFLYDRTGVEWSNGEYDTEDTASWLDEAPSATRGEEVAFPKRVFLICNGNNLSIIDADDMTMWMVFTFSATPRKTAYAEGRIAVLFDEELRVYSFNQDEFWHFSAGTTTRYLEIVNRNSPSSGTAGSDTIRGTRLLDVDFRKILSSWYLALGEAEGLTFINFTDLQVGDSFNKQTFSGSVDVATTVITEDSGVTTLLQYGYPNPIDYRSFVQVGYFLSYSDPFVAKDVWITDVTELSIDVIDYDGNVGDGASEITFDGEPALLTLWAYATYYKPTKLVSILDDGGIIFSIGNNLAHSHSAWRTGTLSNPDQSTPPIDFDDKQPFKSWVRVRDTILMATSSGVCITSKDEIEAGNTYELRYSDLNEATYSNIFLEQIRPVEALAVDPQNGNILFSVGSKIFEVTGYHTIERTIQADTDILSLAGFSNQNLEIE